MTYVRLPPIPSVKDIIKLYRLSAVKQLSQNFLLDDRLTDKIVKSAGKLTNSQVLEVGPGPGGITRAIIRRLPKKVIVVEKDKRFSPILDMLKDASAPTVNMDIMFDDIMSVNMSNLFDPKEKKDWFDDCPNIHIIGNLPFSVSTALIIRWLHDISEQRGAWSNGRVQMTLTFQKEVAERLVASIGDEQRCRLSVMAQAWTIPTVKFIIPSTAFVPKPEVDVGVVKFVPRLEPLTTHKFEFFEKVNRHLFHYRQKYSVRCMETLFPPDCREQLAQLMYKLADIDPETQSFHLSIEEIDRLATAYKYVLEKHPEFEEYDYRAPKKVLSKSLTKSVTIEDPLTGIEVKPRRKHLYKESV